MSGWAFFLILIAVIVAAIVYYKQYGSKHVNFGTSTVKTYVPDSVSESASQAAQSVSSTSSGPNPYIPTE